MSDFDTDFSSFDDEFTPEPAIRPDIKTLADGVYDFEVLDAELTRAANGDAICNLGLKASSGQVVQHTYWLNKQANVNRMGYDFGVLGLEVGPPLNETIPAAVKALSGIKFRGVKSSREYQGKTYHDLSVTMRVGSTPMPVDAAAF